jgi:hypothetical protein
MIDFIPPSINGSTISCEGPNLPNINNCCVTTAGSYYLTSKLDLVTQAQNVP